MLVVMKEQGPVYVLVSALILLNQVYEYLCFLFIE